MAEVGSEAVAVDVGCPFEFRGVGVAGADVAGLELLELLLGAEFVGLGWSVLDVRERSIWWGSWREGAYHVTGERWLDCYCMMIDMVV